MKEVLSHYPFIKAYRDGKISRRQFLDDLSLFREQLLEVISKKEFVSLKSEVPQKFDSFDNVKHLLSRIALIPQRPFYTVSELKSLGKADKENICICDFYVKDCEKGTLKPWGFIFKHIVIIDHHAPVNQFTKRVSSTNLAILYVRSHGPVPHVFINHTDCDSVLSSLIMTGILPPLDIFGYAAIAADHTGEENLIADLLQSLDDSRDLNFSVKNLFRVLHGRHPSLKASMLIQKRYRSRRKIRRLVYDGKFLWHGKVAYIVLKKKIEGELVTALIPHAKAICLASRMSNGKWEVKVRLGLKADGNLNLLGLPNFGGRWNAGSTKRSGGTNISPEEYAKIVDSRLGL